ncbi:MAG: cell envelope integrity protein TolA [Gammaproteobacteria bacterium]|nr:cell envelope integrity protein TolA [Gammaproteobacteria bacterium]
MAPTHQVKANDYLLPAVVSVGLHGLLVLAVVWGWEAASEPKQRVAPRYVEARLVALKPESEKPKQTAAPKPKVVDVSAQQRQREVEAAEKKRLATEKAERERLRKLAEEKKKQQAEQEKLRQQKLERERLEKERLEKERLEQQRRQRELERQRSQEAAFADALAEEKEMLMAQESEATAQSYVAAMADKIERSWSRPPSARRGMKCELRIQLVPTGDVIHVAVIKSSGNSAFDRSAEQAVNKVGRFEVLKDMPPDMFERYFRQLTLVFDPQDLRQ